MSNELKDWLIDHRLEEQEKHIEFLYEFLSRNFGEPCTWSFENIDVSDYIFNHNDMWCEENCGNVPDIECWKKYLQIRIETEARVE